MIIIIIFTFRYSSVDMSENLSIDFSDYLSEDILITSSIRSDLFLCRTLNRCALVVIHVRMMSPDTSEIHLRYSDYDVQI